MSNTHEGKISRNFVLKNVILSTKFVTKNVNSIHMQLAKENKKFFFGHIREGARLKDFEVAIEWLCDCGLIKRVYRANKPAMPLKVYTEFSAFKLFLLDVGLLGALSGLDARSILQGNQSRGKSAGKKFKMLL